MAYRIVKTDSFQRDLDAAVAYIALSLENKGAALSLLDATEKVYDNLECMPRPLSTRAWLSESHCPQLCYNL